MITQDALLVQLICLLDRVHAPPRPACRRRGRPVVYPDRLFSRALVIMIVRRLHKVIPELEPPRETREVPETASKARARVTF